MSIWIISSDKKWTIVKVGYVYKEKWRPRHLFKDGHLPHPDLYDRDQRSVVKENEALTMRSVGLHKIRDLEKTFCLRNCDLNISKLVGFQLISVDLPINAKWSVCILIFTRLSINIYQYILILFRFI